jgi:hypothetical protein
LQFGDGETGRIAAFSARPEQCVVIHNGVDVSASTRRRQLRRSALRAQYGIPAEAPVLVYVGSGFERKGVAQALRAIQPHPDVWLVVVGGDKKLAPTGNWPASWALPSECTLPARKRCAQPLRHGRRFYSAHHVRTLWLGGGEAMACGLPVLTSTRCGGAEWVSPATGWLAAPQDTGLAANVAAWLAARASGRRWQAGPPAGGRTNRAAHGGANAGAVSPPAAAARAARVEAGMMKASRFPGRALIFLSLLLRLPWQWLRRKPKPEQVQRVLILHQFLLGDALMATSLLAKAGNVIRRLISSWPARPVRQHLYAGQPYGVRAFGWHIRNLPRCASCLPCRVSTWCC